jgi:5-methyltetrahydrofolate--homocysteine methyltransferase
MSAMPSQAPISPADLSHAVAAGNRAEAKRLTQILLDQGLPPQKIIEDGLVSGMRAIGEQFKCGEAFVPEMLVASRAMREAMALVEPLLLAGGITPKYTAVIGTVQGDLHDLGKNLVATMWRGANFAVIDLGTNIPPQRFVEAALQHRPQVVGLSALLTTTMPAMRQTVAALRTGGVTGVRIIIGGAPITQDFADEIGADGYAPDAASAVDVALRLASDGARPEGPASESPADQP